MPALEKFYFKKKGTVAPLEFLTEPVVHSTKWTTGSWLLPCFVPFPRFLTELVVHSTEWSTSSRLLPCFAPLSQLSGLASGPLDGVVHWLPAFALFCAFFPVSDRASGPLALGFCPVLRLFPSF